jgi:hypothetical protein
MKILILALFMLFASTAHAQLADFTTDGCSVFIDRPLLVHSRSWAHCCVTHDLAYWQGGTAQDRAYADNKLFSCVSKAVGDEEYAVQAMSWIIWLGVKMGGSPYGTYNPFYWRWGYGWNESRYHELSAAEKLEVAAKLIRVYKNIPVFSAELDLTEAQRRYVSRELYLQIVRFQQPHR